MLGFRVIENITKYLDMDFTEYNYSKITHTSARACMHVRAHTHKQTLVFPTLLFYWTVDMVI